jgi:hypothetical protein
MKVLMVLTSHDRLGNTGRKTGFWLEEMAAPYYVFKEAGAQITLASPKGGRPPLDPKSNDPAFDEETFGPVAALTRVPDINLAVRAANASQFGLSGNLWTRNVELARKVARDLYTGGVFINGVTATDPRVPVGGVKNSGYGRELSRGRRRKKRAGIYLSTNAFSGGSDRNS